jgi:hypothetical protein
MSLREILADLLLENGSAPEALREYEAVLKVAPRRFNATAGAARAAAQANDPVKARSYAMELREIAPNSQAPRSELSWAHSRGTIVDAGMDLSGVAVQRRSVLLVWSGARTRVLYRLPHREGAISRQHFVFLVIFSYFAVPAALQHRVLFWGVLGALIMRATFIVLGAALLQKFHWLIYIFGAFLVSPV